MDDMACMCKKWYTSKYNRRLAALRGHMNTASDFGRLISKDLEIDGDSEDMAFNMKIEHLRSIDHAAYIRLVWDCLTSRDEKDLFEDIEDVLPWNQKYKRR